MFFLSMFIMMFWSAFAAGGMHKLYKAHKICGWGYSENKFTLWLTLHFLFGPLAYIASTCILMDAEDTCDHLGI
jgi:hypothetical protein